MAVLLCGLVVDLCLIGEICIFLNSGTWSNIPFGVVLSLMFNLGNPKLAWPNHLQHYMYGPIGYYLILIGVAAVQITLCFGAVYTFKAYLAKATEIRFFTRTVSVVRRIISIIEVFTTGIDGFGKIDPFLSSARWAKPSELTILRVPPSKVGKGRLGLGSSGGAVLAAEQHHSVIVIGPTQTQKTSGFALPALLEWDGPILAASVKVDLLQHSYEWRKKCGQVWIYDPTNVTGFPSTNWSPLSACRTWYGAKRMAAWLCQSKQGSVSGFPEADFWYSMAAKLLSPLMFAAAWSNKSMQDVLRWVDEQEIDEVMGLLSLTGVDEAVQAQHANCLREERQRSSIYSTAENVLSPFSDIDTSHFIRPDFEPEFLFNGEDVGHTESRSLYLCAPTHEQRRLQPMFTALVNQVLDYGFELATRRAKPLSPGLLVVLDEAANIAPLSDLDSLASTGASHGIELVTIWQDMAQITAKYGTRAATVVNNHRAKVFLSGITDPETLEHASKLAGFKESTVSTTTANGHGQHSISRSPAPRQLAPADALRRIRPGEGVLIYGHLFPIRLKLRAWFSIPHLLKRGLERESSPVNKGEGGGLYSCWKISGR